MASIDIGTTDAGGNSPRTVGQVVAGPSLSIFQAEYPRCTSPNNSYDWVILQTAVDQGKTLELPEKKYWMLGNTLTVPLNGKMRIIGSDRNNSRIIGNSLAPVVSNVDNSNQPLYRPWTGGLVGTANGGSSSVYFQDVQIQQSNIRGSGFQLYNSNRSRIIGCNFSAPYSVLSQSFNSEITSCSFSWLYGLSNTKTTDYVHRSAYPTFEDWIAEVRKACALKVFGHASIQDTTFAACAMGLSLQGFGTRVECGRIEVCGLGVEFGGESWSFDNPTGTSRWDNSGFQFMTFEANGVGMDVRDLGIYANIDPFTMQCETDLNLNRSEYGILLRNVGQSCRVRGIVGWNCSAQHVRRYGTQLGTIAIEGE